MLAGDLKMVVGYINGASEGVSYFFMPIKTCGYTHLVMIFSTRRIRCVLSRNSIASLKLKVHAVVHAYAHYAHRVVLHPYQFSRSSDFIRLSLRLPFYLFNGTLCFSSHL